MLKGPLRGCPAAELNWTGTQPFSSDGWNISYVTYVLHVQNLMTILTEKKSHSFTPLYIFCPDAEPSTQTISEKTLPKKN